MSFFNTISRFAFTSLALLMLSFSVFTSIPVQAQTVDSLNILGIKCFFYAGNAAIDPEGCTADTALSAVILDFLVALAPVLAVLVVVWGGIQIVQGSQESVTRGKKYISGALIGLTVVILSNTIITFIQNTIKPNQQNQILDSQPAVTLIVNTVNNFLVPVGIVVTVFFIVIGAYRLILSNGDTNKAQQGRSAIFNAILGVIVILLAVTITQIIVILTGAAESTVGGGL